ncbi:MAG: hypothetical protein K2X66_16715, partial [Cyanobacteria bacterium]|nr:hypothetical protein [Cyanobacteriota bacterium]
MKHLFNFFQPTHSARSLTVSGKFFKKSLSLLGVLGLSTVLGTHTSGHALGLSSLSLEEITNSRAHHGVAIQKLHPRVSVHHTCYQTENFSTLKSQWQDFGGQQSFSHVQPENLSILTNRIPEVPSQEAFSSKAFNKELYQNLVEALVSVSKKASTSLNAEVSGLVIPKEYLSASLKPAFNKVLTPKSVALRPAKDSTPSVLSDSESKRIASALSVITLTPEGSGDADLFENNKLLEKQPNASSKLIKVSKVDKKEAGLKAKGNHPEVLSEGVAMEAFTEDEEEEMLTQKLQDLLRPKLASANSPEHRRSGYPSGAQSHSDSNRLAYASIRPSRGVYG